jgi:uncharacterized membrane protein
MLLDAVLLSVTKVFSRRSDHKDSVAILPEMKVQLLSGVCVKHPSSSYQVLLSGSMDYGIAKYENNYHNRSMGFILRILLFIHSTA